MVGAGCTHHDVSLHDAPCTVDSSVSDMSAGADGISGFTRALILRLVLSPERVWVSLRWAEGGGAGAGCAHPAYLGHAVLPLPLCSTVRQLLAEHRPPCEYVTCHDAADGDTAT